VDKNKLIEELKSKKAEIIEKVEEKVEEVKEEKTTKRRRSKKKVLEEVVKEEEKTEEATEEVQIVAVDPEFEAFKEKFLNSSEGEDLKELIEFQQEIGNDIFDLDFYLHHRYQDPRITGITIDPSADDIIRGGHYKFYLFKPMYNKEYVQFIKDYGSRESHPEEFMTRMFETCLLFPKLTKDQIEKLPIGTALSIYRSMLDISDFNKTFRVFEV
jgi:hypothetical protein